MTLLKLLLALTALMFISGWSAYCLKDPDEVISEKEYPEVFELVITMKDHLIGSCQKVFNQMVDDKQLTWGEYNRLVECYNRGQTLKKIHQS